MYVAWHQFVKRFGGDEFQQPPKIGEQKYTTARTLQALLRLADHHNGRQVAEIGTAYGETTIMLARTCPDSIVHTFDVCRELVGQTASPFDFEIMERNQVGSMIQKQPMEVQDRIKMTIAHPILIRGIFREHKPYSVVFIDGDHTWRNVVDDTKVAVDCITADGVIIWDDFWDKCSEVVAAINLINGRIGNKIANVLDTKLCYLTLTPPLLKTLRAAVRDL